MSSNLLEIRQSGIKPIKALRIIDREQKLYVSYSSQYTFPNEEISSQRQ